MINTLFWACAFLLVFTFFASLDGLYFHLYKYRLFEKSESKKEHQLHTWNSFLFFITIYLLFCENFAGLMIWLAVFFTVLTLIVEFLDIFEEKRSRKAFGGLTSLEFAIHFGMSGLRATYTTLILSQKPVSAWLLSSPILISEQNYPPLVRFIGYSVVLVGIPIFVLHFILLFYKPKEYF